MSIFSLEYRSDRLDRFLRYLWMYKLTRNGRFLFVSLVAATSMGSASLAMPLYHLVFALFGLFFVAFAAGLLLRARIIVRGELPEKISAGEELHAEYTLVNESRIPAMQVSIRFFNLPSALQQIDLDQIAPYLGQGDSVKIPLRIQTHKRGYYDLNPPVAYSTFPFNLFRTGCRRKKKPTANSLLVLPGFHTLNAVEVPMGRRHQPGGVSLTSNIGESPEYIGNRDFRPGDSMRHIDFRSWARLARPVVREYMEEYYCRIALVLDTYVPPKRKELKSGFPDFEAAISLTASVADGLSRGEFLLDIFAAGPELYVFRSGRSTAHFDNVLEILACLEPCRANPFDKITPALSSEFSNISTLICLFLDWDESREKLVKAAMENGAGTKIIIVRDTPTTIPLANAQALSDSVVQVTTAEILDGMLGEI